jgi:hypothetical protein
MSNSDWSYEDFARASEARWNVERDVDWSAIDVELARRRPDHLDLLRRATLIESYHPMSTRAVIGLFIEDIDATSVLTIELFEGFRHFWVLRRYLERCGIAIADEELVRLRTESPEKTDYRPEQRYEVLLNFAWSEHFAGYFFRRIAAETAEPVLGELMRHCMNDEFRHCNGALRVLGKHAQRDPAVKRELLQAMHRFRHYGNDIGPVPIAMENDLEATTTIVRRTLALVGADWSEYEQAGVQACGMEAGTT